MYIIIIIVKNEKIRVTLCENAAGALYIVNKMCVDGLRCIHIRSLQHVKITCKFTERFLRNLSFCSGTFFSRTLYIHMKYSCAYIVVTKRKIVK